MERKGRLDLPIVKGKYLYKMTDCTTYKESQALKGISKMKYDKEHKDSLEKYSEIRERMQSLLDQGEKITPKQ